MADGKFIIIPFRCAKCGKELEAHVDATPGFSAGWQTAKCPHCGLEQGDGKGSFPARVLRTIERVGPKYSSGPTVISKQATQALSAVDVPASRKRTCGGEEQGVPFALMVAFGMEMAHELGYGSTE
jgi:hypothetical protein